VSDSDFMRELHIQLDSHVHRLPCTAIVIASLMLFFIWTFHKWGGQ
jgi:hypothetical protein